jgi:hypothetical protein
MTETKRENEHIRGAATLVLEKARRRIERIREGRHGVAEGDARHALLMMELEEAERAERLAAAALHDLVGREDTSR